MIAYLVVVLVSTLAGVGLLSALGVPDDRVSRWLLAPGACLMCWIILLSAGLSIGLTTSRLALPVWVLTILAALFGIRHVRARMTGNALGLIAVAAVAPLAVMAPDVVRGLRDYIGGPAQDGWSYVAFAQYLWTWPRGTEGGLAPLYQYADHLSHVRLAGSGLIGFLSPLTGAPGDTQAAVGCFVGWTLFVFASSCLAYGRAVGLRRMWGVALALLALASRWVFGAIQIHNDDNLIAISFLPVALAVVAGAATPGWRNAIALGVVLAASWYAYPEMATFVVLGVALALAARVARDRRFGVWSGYALGAAIVAVMLLGPGLRDVLAFLSNQVGVATATAGARAGEGNFAALVNGPSWWMTFWGYEPIRASGQFGGLATTWSAGQMVLDVALWLLAAWGIVQFLAERQWDLVALAALLTVGDLVMVVREHYSYGAYKFLLFEGWILAAFVIAGAKGMTSWLRERLHLRPGPIVVAGVVLVLGLGTTAAARELAFDRAIAGATIRPYRSLLEADRLAEGAVLVSLDDDAANAWAVYFLRGHSIRLMQYRGYMAMSHVVPLMNRAAPVDLSTAHYVLSDDGMLANRDVVWMGGPYVLWRIPVDGVALLGAVDNPNGAERLDGRSFYWLGATDTHVHVIATVDGDATLSARFIPGPSLPTSPERHLLLTSDLGSRSATIGRDGDATVDMPVRAGDNTITIRDTDKAAVKLPSDPRTLLVGFEGLQVAMADPQRLVSPTCHAAFGSGWHERERFGSGWLRWSSGTGRVTITADESGDVELTGDVLSFARPNRIDVRLNGQLLQTWAVDDPTWGFHPFLPVVFHLDAGRPVTMEFTSAAPAVTQKADPRPLAFALKALVLRRGGRACGGFGNDGF